MSQSPVPLSPVPSSPDSGPADHPADGFQQSIAAARAGQLSARGELLERCRRYLLAVASRNLSRDLQAKVAASDLAQEAFTHAHANFDRFQGGTERELLAWLQRIMDYSLLTAQRRYCLTAKRELRREVPLDLQGQLSDLPHEFAISTPRPESRAILQEEQQRLSECLAQMSREDREVIELRNVANLSFVEIAARTSRTPDAVRKHWGRALDRLSEMLDDRQAER